MRTAYRIALAAAVAALALSIAAPMAPSVARSADAAGRSVQASQPEAQFILVHPLATAEFILVHPLAALVTGINPLTGEYCAYTR